MLRLFHFMDFKEIKVGKKHKAIVDIGIYDKLNNYSWWFSTGYAYTKIDNKVVLMHRLIANAEPNVRIDHVNRNRLDNRLINLRFATHQQNMMNATFKTINCTSKFKGVHLNKKKGKWVASIQFNKKKIHIGYYENETDAAKAYNLKATTLFGEFAVLNNF